LPDRRELPHWHCNKRWTDITKARDALAILESPTFENKTWNEGKQAFYAILLKKAGLSDSTNPRSTRAILGTFKFFGLACTEHKKLIITPAGKEFIHGDIRKILKAQLLKWQYPNPFEAKGSVAPYTRNMRLFPFRVLTRLAKEIGPIHENELSLFVWKIRSDEQTEIAEAKQRILHFRKLSDSEKRELCQSDLLFVTNHEYEAHLRPYILATGLCTFDGKQRILFISKEAEDEVNEILAEALEVKTDWKDEDEWFQYYGDTRYYHPPISIKFQLISKKVPAAGVYVKVSKNGAESYSVTDDKGFTILSLYENQKYRLEVILPENGSILHKDFIAIRPGQRELKIEMAKVAISRKETVDEIIRKIHQLLKTDFDQETRERLQMKSRIEKKEIDRKQIRYIRGGRFEELVYRLLCRFKGTVFNDVVWNGKVGEWGLPVPAQKLSEETGKKLPDILIFQDSDIYVVETTLLKGRAQWEKPEAVSVPEHIENMIKQFRGRNVSGVFIATELDSSVEVNLVTRAMNQGYEVVPIEAEEFLRTIKLLEASGRSFWKDNFEHLWNIHRRSVSRRS